MLENAEIAILSGVYDLELGVGNFLTVLLKRLKSITVRFYNWRQIRRGWILGVSLRESERRDFH